MFKFIMSLLSSAGLLIVALIFLLLFGPDMFALLLKCIFIPLVIVMVITVIIVICILRR